MNLPHLLERSPHYRTVPHSTGQIPNLYRNNYLETKHSFHHRSPMQKMRSPSVDSSTAVVGNHWENLGIVRSTSHNPSVSGVSEGQAVSGTGRSELSMKQTNFFTDTSDVDQLTRELREIRDQILAAKAIENRLLVHLQRLGAGAPKLPMEIDCQDIDNSELSVQLQIERQKRVEAEQALKDVERECKEPFVVPALLKAFVNISKLTSGY